MRSRPDIGDVTRLLRRPARASRRRSSGSPLVYEDLRRLARRQLGYEYGERTLNPTALVHESYLKLGRRDGRADRAHFLASPRARCARCWWTRPATARPPSAAAGSGSARPSPTAPGPASSIRTACSRWTRRSRGSSRASGRWWSAGFSAGWRSRRSRRRWASPSDGAPRLDQGAGVALSRLLRWVSPVTRPQGRWSSRSASATAPTAFARLCHRGERPAPGQGGQLAQPPRVRLESPVWRHWLESCPGTTLVRYDERGCGLSDWKVEDLSFEAWVRDLEAVVDALGLERFPLLGISQGGPIAIAYAVRHPERVSHLVLYGGYTRGRESKSLPAGAARGARNMIRADRGRLGHG